MKGSGDGGRCRGDEARERGKPAHRQIGCRGNRIAGRAAGYARHFSRRGLEAKRDSRISRRVGAHMTFDDNLSRAHRERNCARKGRCSIRISS